MKPKWGSNINLHGTTYQQKGNLAKAKVDFDMAETLQSKR